MVTYSVSSSACICVYQSIYLFKCLSISLGYRIFNYGLKYQAYLAPLIYLFVFLCFYCLSTYLSIYLSNEYILGLKILKCGQIKHVLISQSLFRSAMYLLIYRSNQKYTIYLAVCMYIYIWKYIFLSVN